VNRGLPALVLLVSGLMAVTLADWQSIGPEGGQVTNIVQSYTDPNVLFATSGSNPTTIVTSSNKGQSWSVAGSYAYTNYCMTIGPTGNLYAGSSHRIYRSTNGGATWNYTSMSNLYTYDMFAHPTDPNVVYGAGYRYNGSMWVLAFIKSTNGGSSWTTTDLETQNSYARCIAVSMSDPDVIYVGGYRLPSPYTPIMYRSTDGGSTWTEVSAA
jgi:hypothetical protein